MLMDKAWDLQDRVSLKLRHWFFVTIGARFFFALLSFAFMVYAGFVALYFIYIEHLEPDANFLTTGRIPVYLNPILIWFICSVVFLLLFLDQKGKL